MSLRAAPNSPLVTDRKSEAIRSKVASLEWCIGSGFDSRPGKLGKAMGPAATYKTRHGLHQIYRTQPMPADNKIAGVPLVDDWRNWKRWWSMRLVLASTLFGAVPIAYQALPPEHVSMLPTWLDNVSMFCGFITTILTGAARVIRQTPDPEGDKA